MKSYLNKLFIFLFSLFILSCDVGLGDEVDLVAPEIHISKMISGESEINGSELSGGVYCRRNVSFIGIATDNIKVESVYAEIKWSNEDSFNHVQDAILDGNNFTFNIDFEKEGTAYLKIVVTDKSGNYGIKSSKVVTLLIDDTAPVGSAWYINRKLNGIQYSLKDIDELKNIDFTNSQNKDAAQNVAFSIHSAFNDSMGIKPNSISIEIRDENGEFICEVQNSESSLYSPVFEITHDLLVANRSELSTGKHFLQVWYNAEDIVTLPESNKVQSEPVEGGWFVWWPESDNPKVSLQPAVDTQNQIYINIDATIMLTSFDDDALKETYCALLTTDEYSSISSTWYDNPESIINAVTDSEKARRTNHKTYTTERDNTAILFAPNLPQVMHLLVYEKENADKVIYRDYLVNVTDSSAPILFVSSPENNSIPNVTMKDSNSQLKAMINISGQTLDTSGCEYLEFVWVPDCIANSGKRSLAEEFLSSLDSAEEHKVYYPEKNEKYKVTELENGLKLWSVKLDDAETLDTGFKKQIFDFEIDLLNDFICNEINEKINEKYFLVKLTRKDDNFIYQEYKLSVDVTKPIIKVNGFDNDMNLVEDSKDIIFELSASKSTGLAIDSTKYKIERVDVSPSEILEGSYDDTSKTYKVSILKTELQEMSAKNIKPSYRFYAEDIFGNEGFVQKTIVISNLPQLNSITSSAPTVCKKDDKIFINANFSNIVFVDESKKPYLKLNGIKNNGENYDRGGADYYSGSGSQTITFLYTVQEGDSAEKLEVNNEEGLGPIETNGDANLINGEKVHLTTLPSGKNLQDYKSICIDGISPKITKIDIESDCSSENKNNNISYLQEGRNVTVSVTFSENVFVQGTPKFLFDNGLELPFTSATSTKIIFSKKIENSDVNGRLEYFSNSCIVDYECIKDNAGNSVNLLLDSKETSNIYVDTEKPAIPLIIDNNTKTNLIGGKKQNQVKFELKYEASDSDSVVLEYSLDGGSSWDTYTYSDVVTVSEFAQVTARSKDYAGNYSNPANIIKLDINNSFPDFIVECINQDGSYSVGDVLKFKVSFAENVSISANSGAYIKISGQKNEDVISENAKAILSSKEAQSSVSFALFEYRIQKNDNFTLMIKKADVNLSGISDLYGFEQGSKILSSDCKRNIICDGVPPVVMSMTPNNGEKSDNNVYQNGNKIKIVFNEEIQKGSGNIILRQVYGWGIPPVLTSEEYNIICSKLDYDDKNILVRQSEDGVFLEDMEELNKAPEDRFDNKQYHGTGQYIGPYKKSSHGLDGVNPDISTKFVLDFDIGIFETDEPHYIGKTFDDNHSYKEPSIKTSVNEIRGALEKSGLHQRVLDVTLPLVEIGDDNKTVTLTFPAGLIDKNDELPNGREWELVIEKGAFLDITGNEFGADLTTNDAIQSEGKQTEISDTWKRGRSSISDDSKPVVLLKTYGNESFYSDKVATPFIRVDRYSYGLKIFQSDSDGNKTSQIENDGIKPTGFVRVRIDCETKGAKILYNSDKTTKSESDTPNDGIKIEGDNEDCRSYITTTEPKIPDLNSLTKDYIGFFAAGSGDYKKSCKEIIAAYATKDNFTNSEIGTEGVFQTVAWFNNPTSSDGTSSADCDGEDLSIRGTTGFAGEPSISPFPLRDSKIGSPYLRRAYREETSVNNSKDYYWVSYEILVLASFSNYTYGKSVGYYDWAKNWGILKPGELTKCTGMKNWK
ncbi:MAG: hypothetical protein J6J11_08435 [Treponema sp.]|nr:hypothetical protein [Treponema sp.]